MKRPMTLVASILSLSFSAIYLLIMIDTFAHFGAIVSFVENQLETFYACANIFTTIIVICAVVFSILALPTWRASANDYKKKKWAVICAIVFNFTAVIGAICLIVVRSYMTYTFFNAFEGIFCLAAGVLFVVDLAIENKRAAKYEAKKAQDAAIEQLLENKVAVIETKLSRLNAMKNNGLISQVEYDVMKQRYLKDATQEQKQQIEHPKSEMQLKFEKFEDMKNRGLINEDEYKKLKADYIRKHI